jgi:MFS family permease
VTLDAAPDAVPPAGASRLGRFRASLRLVVACLSDRRLRRVLVAFGLFGVSEWARWVGLLVYGFHHSGATGAGLISVIQLVPAALAIPITSSLSDRYERARVLSLSYLVAGVGTAGSGLAIFVGAPFVVVALLAAVGLVGITMVRPTQAALLPQLADTPEELTAANVASGFVLSASLFAGPAIASLLLAVSGSTSVVLVAGAMLLLASLVVALVPRSDRAPVGVSEVRVLGGFGELARNRPAAWLICLFGAQNVAWGMVDVLIVTLAIDRLGLDASAVGILSAALGVGALLGGAATVALVGRQRLAPGLTFGVLCWGLPLLVIGLAGAPAPIIISFAVAGVGVSFFNVATRTLLQRIVPDDMLGRVFGLLESGYMGAWAIGSALAPVALALLGLSWSFVIAGAAVPSSCSWLGSRSPVPIGMRRSPPPGSSSCSGRSRCSVCSPSRCWSGSPGTCRRCRRPLAPPSSARANQATCST